VLGAMDMDQDATGEHSAGIAAVAVAPPAALPSAGGGSAGIDISALHSFLEDELLANFYMTAARRATSRSQLQAWTSGAPGGWADVHSLLQLLDYHLDAASPWDCLGLLTMEGPAPSEVDIDRRWHRARALLSFSRSPGWQQDEKKAAKEAWDCLEAAHRHCHELLPGVLTRRRRDKGTGTDRWRELAEPGLTFLVNTPASENEMVATQLSTVSDLPENLAEHPRLMPVPEARRWQERLDKGASFFDQLPRGGLVAWAPSSPAALGRLLATVLKTPAAAFAGHPLRLIVPMAVLPGCITCGAIRDLFWHPFMSEKWAPVVREQAFVAQPMQMVLSAAGGPLHTSWGLYIVTVSTHAPLQLPRVLSVAEPVLTVSQGPSFFADCPSLLLPEVIHQVLAAGSTMGVKLGQHSRSPGSAADAPRSRVEFLLPLQGTTEIGVALLLCDLRSRRLDSTVLLATRSIYSDNSALLVELTGPAGLSRVSHLCDEALWRRGWLRSTLQSSRRASVGNAVSHSVSTPGCAAPSRGEGSAESYRTHFGRAARRGMGYDPHAVIAALLAVMRAQSGLALAPADTAAELTPGTWRRLADDDPSLAPGRVRLYLHSAAEVASVTEGQWSCPRDLKHIDLLGFPKSFVDMPTRQLAAQARVYYMGAASSGGMRIRGRAAVFRQAKQASDHILLQATWADWFARSFTFQLDSSAEHVEALGVARATLEREILRVDDATLLRRPMTREQARRVQVAFQRTAAASLPRATTLNLEMRLRHKLGRWAVPRLPRVRVANCLAFLQALRRRFPPRVWAATWRTLWDGWASSRRTHGRIGLAGCMFRCSPAAADSIEHYANWPVLHEAADAVLRLPRPESPGDRLAAFLGLDYRAGHGPEKAVKVSIHAAAAYRTHCLCRHGRVSRGPAAREALGQSFRDAVRGRGAAARIYDAARGWN
ncbi:unnamed protein product, partial [Prorocentrum cordatum]